jgi:hypothetical protein
MMVSIHIGIWILVGLIPYDISCSQMSCGERRLSFRAIFWSLQLLCQADGTRTWTASFYFRIREE